MIFICGPSTYIPKGAALINVTSHSKDFGAGLSPFHLGPVELYNGFVAKNVENAWQYSKVYLHHVKDGNPTDEYFKWAHAGWDNTTAVRYPMGKGAIPEYSYWDGKKLGYVEARKKIYYPLYQSAARKSPAFTQLEQYHAELSKNYNDLWLWDFDGFNHRDFGMTLTDVVNRTERKMGHAFVLAGMMTGFMI